ncbi:MAG: hypothetical protein E6J41_11710 [Chloroflexi bacterium]|nr:MAG: hypothetical protein E6J41_11710 [Chloroflexota bacterium]
MWLGSTVLASAVLALPVSPAAVATIRAVDSGAWQPSSAAIAPGETVRWENDDAVSAHAVECVRSASSDGCPWPAPQALPPARRAADGTLVPSVVCGTFSRPGIFSFRDPLHPSMTGTVLVGAPPAGRSASVTPCVASAPSSSPPPATPGTSSPGGHPTASRAPFTAAPVAAAAALLVLLGALLVVLRRRGS